MNPTFLPHLNLTVHLGAKPKGDDSAVPDLAEYVDTGVLPSPLASVNYTLKKQAWDTMLGNDTVGDCTIAGAMHMISDWEAYASGKVPGFTTAQAIQVYSAITGYVPGDPSTDNGAELIDVLNYWKSTGILGHKILGFVKIDPSNDRLVRLGIDLFGGIYPGVALPISAQAQVGKEWEPESGPDGAPGSWGGHCPPILSYNVPSDVEGYATWGTIQKGNVAFRHEYMTEAYAVLGPEWLNPQKKAPNGFDLTQLLAD
ncbi:MAG: hypothetical protein ABSG46_17020, partial [Candidatus Binataceae bacterium]